MAHRTHTTDTTDFDVAAPLCGATLPKSVPSVLSVLSRGPRPSLSRFPDIERHQATARRFIAPAALATYAPLREAIESLTTSEAPDAEFLAKLRDLHRDIPSFFRKLDPTPLANALEEATAPALIAGVLERVPPRKLQAADGKPCGDSFIPAWKQCNKGISPATQALVKKYRAGHTADAPTGRKVAFGQRIADHIEKDWASRDPRRASFARLAEKAVASPSEIWQHGTSVVYFKPMRKMVMVVFATQFEETEERAESFLPMPSKRAEKKKRGQKIWPR